MKHSWKRSALTAFIVLALCLAVWFWDSHRKVDISLRTQIDVQNVQNATSLHMSFIDKDENTANQVTASLLGSHGVTYQNIALRPGTYKIQAVVEYKGSDNLYIEKTIEIPSQDAEISMILRR